MNTTTERKTFEALKRDFETAYAIGDYAAELLALATAAPVSCLNKCLDPQGKTATGRDTVSNSGYSAALVALRRGVYRDRALLENTAAAAERATRIEYNADGDPVTVTDNADALNALNTLIGDTLTDGIDLVQVAALALLEQSAAHADGGAGWLDKPYTVRRLARKVYIKSANSAAYRDEETTPIQEVYRAVRRAIADSRAVQTDPRNGYVYLDALTDDGDTVYQRLDKWVDLGGAPCNGRDYAHVVGAPAAYGDGGGHYTADRATVESYEKALAALALTDRQMTVVSLRMRGYGYKAIASYLGVTRQAVQNTLAKIQAKCEKIGFTPEKFAGMNAAADEK